MIGDEGDEEPRKMKKMERQKCYFALHVSVVHFAQSSVVYHPMYICIPLPWKGSFPPLALSKQQIYFVKNHLKNFPNTLRVTKDTECHIQAALLVLLHHAFKGETFTSQEDSNPAMSLLIMRDLHFLVYENEIGNDHDESRSHMYHNTNAATHLWYQSFFALPLAKKQLSSSTQIMSMRTSSNNSCMDKGNVVNHINSTDISIFSICLFLHLPLKAHKK